MKRNTYIASLLLLVVTITLSHSSEISYAEDEHPSEIHENKIENAAEHAEEERSSHEGKESHEIEEEPRHEHMRETGEGPHVHSSATAEAAQWVGLGILFVAAPIFGLKIRSVNKVAYKNVVLTLAVGVGIMHLLLAPDHLVDVGMEHGIFFAIAGSAQIGFGLLFIAKPKRRLAIIGAVATIGSIILYFITRIENLPEPFGAPEGIDTVGIIAKIVEISLVALLIYLAVYIRKRKATSLTFDTNCVMKI